MKNPIRMIGFGLSLVTAAAPLPLRAHCDTLSGPVAVSAREAFAKKDVTPVLMWVKATDERTIRDAFQKAIAVQSQSKEASSLAELWFLETLVRIHRAGEGAPYTGLKEEETAEPGIAAADRSLVSGRIDDVLKATAAPLEAALREKHQRVVALKPHASHSVEAGRAYVAAYVDYIHFAERLASMAQAGASGAHAEHAH